jgi:hypothetical protein
MEDELDMVIALNNLEAGRQEMDKPDWWPHNPYPVSVFPLERGEYAEVVPDPQTRTALIGMLGREFWDIASNAIWEAMKENPDLRVARLAEVAKEFIDAYLPLQMNQSIHDWDQLNKKSRDELRAALADLEEVKDEHQ